MKRGQMRIIFKYLPWILVGIECFSFNYLNNAKHNQYLYNVYTYRYIYNTFRDNCT